MFHAWTCPICKALRAFLPKKCNCGFIDVKEYISIGTYFGTNQYNDELLRNADAFLLKLNSLLQEIDESIPNIKFNMTSGYRSPQYNAAIGGAKSSKHCEAKAIDLEDTDHKIGTYLQFNPIKLMTRDFACEDLNYTIRANGNKWVHIQDGLPASKKTFFIPYSGPVVLK